MKIFFSIMLIFLFLSCSNVTRTFGTVVPDEDFVSDEDITEDDESDAENMQDADIEKDDDEIDDNTDFDIDNVESTGISDLSIVGCTGQTKCYDMEKEIDCPKEGETFYGQDAQYAEMGKCLPRSYTIKQYDDGETVIDNNTGLEWLRGFILGDCTSANVYCNNLKLGGGNWRISSVLEQFTIVDADYSDPVVNNTYFPDTPSYFFCSNECGMAAGFQHREVYLTGMDFKDGLVKSYFSSDIGGGYIPEKQVVGCVRFATDKVRQSIIVQNDSDSVARNWEEALSYCENLTYAGISDWRLPNKNEMMSVSVPVISFWTSTTVAGAHSKAWGSSGNVSGQYPSSEEYFSHYNKSELLFVRCVASNPCAEGGMWNGEKCVDSSTNF